MSNSINDRISRLRSRRSGLDRSSIIAMDAKDFIVNRSLTQEAWERREKTNPTRPLLWGLCRKLTLPTPA